DMLTRIRNANLVRLRKILILKNNLILNILNLLKQEGFIESFEEIKHNDLSKKKLYEKYILVSLKYKGIKQEPYITNIKRVSKPSLRIYSSYKNIKKVLGGIGVAVFAKRKMLIVNRKAKSKKIGGEILFYIW
ncbi:hypothetical protein M569_01283, partial [Genlisea aurea]